MDKIKELYNNPKTGLTGANQFASFNKLNKKDVQNALKEQENYTLNRYTQRNFPRRVIVPLGIDNIWSADLMDVSRTKKENNDVTFILIVVDALSKYVWAVPLKNKQTKTVEQAFEKIISTSKRKPENLWVDEGVEFTGNEMKKLVQKYQINMYHTHTQLKSVYAERFIRTLRMRLTRLADSRGNFMFIDVLQDIIDHYNDLKHTTTKVAPSKFNENNVESAITKISSMKRKADPDQTPIFHKGDSVRMADQARTFGKESDTQRWSRQIYKVSRVYFTLPITYSLIDYKDRPVQGKLYEQELQKVTDTGQYAFEYVLNKLGKKISKKIEGKKYVKVRWLGYNTDDDEDWILDN